MIINKYISAIILILLLLSTSCTNNIINTAEVPTVQKGVIDVRHWNFKKHYKIPLKGEWEFYWKKLLNPADLKNNNISHTYFPIPSYWNNKKINNQTLNGKGYATYRLKIVNDKEKLLALFIDAQMTSYKIWYNGVEIYRCGKVGKNEQNTEPQKSPKFLYISLPKDTSEIVIQIANFSHKKGGFFSAPILADKELFYKERLKSIIKDFFLFGSLVIMSLYHLGLFYFKPNDKSTLYFGIFTFLLALRILFTSSRVFSELFPFVSWSLELRLEYMSVFVAPIFIILFTYELYTKYMSKTITKIFIIIFCMFSITLFFPPYFFTHLVTPSNIIIITAVVYYFIKLTSIPFREEKGALMITISIMLFFILIINDILFVNFKLPYTSETASWGAFVLAIGQALALAKIHTTTFNENERLSKKLVDQNKNLENIVRERTIEIDNQKTSILNKNEKLKEQNQKIININEDLEKQRKSLVKSEAKIKDLINMLPEAIFETNNDGNIVFANDEFYNCLNFKRNTPLNINDLIINEDKDERCFTCHINNKLDENLVLKEQSLKIRKSDNTILPILFSIAAVSNDDNVAYRCIFIDITTQIENENIILNAYNDMKKQTITLLEQNQKIENQRNKLRKATALKDKIFSMIGHDLKGPIGTINNIMTVLINEDLDKDRVLNLLNATRKSSISTYSLLENLLAWANNERGLTKINTTKLDFNKIIQENIDLLNEAAKEKNIIMKSQIDSSLEVLADYNTVSTIIRNLLSNAIKFTNNNGEIIINALTKDGFTEISVKDNGIGIKNDDLKKILNTKEYFSQNGTNGEKGSGLGLQLCLEFIKMNKGDYKIISNEGKGTNFIFTLPTS